MKFKTFILFIILIMVSTIFADKAKDYEDKIKKQESTYKQIENFIRRNPESDRVPEFYIRLAFLSEEINRGSRNDITAQWYKKAKNANPNYAELNELHFNYAYYSYLSKKDEIEKKQEDNLFKLDTEFNGLWPDSLKVTEVNVSEQLNILKELSKGDDINVKGRALFWLGQIYSEIAFLDELPIQFYDKAFNYYSALADLDGHYWQTDGLFKRAWTNYSKGEYKKSIEDFSKILTIIENNTSDDRVLVYEKEAIDLIAESLVDIDVDTFAKSEAAEYAQKILQKLLPPKYIKDAMKIAIDKKIENKAPNQAIDFYQAYLNLYPQNSESLSFLNEMIKLYRTRSNYMYFGDTEEEGKNTAEEKVLEIRKKIINEFTTKSEWYTENKIADDLDFIRKSYNIWVPKWINALQNNTTLPEINRLENYVNEYRSFVEFQNKDFLNNLSIWDKNIIVYLQNFATLNDDIVLMNECNARWNNYLATYDETTRKYSKTKIEEILFNLNNKIYEIATTGEQKENFVSKFSDKTISKTQVDSLFFDSLKRFENFAKNDKDLWIKYKDPIIKDYGYVIQIYKENNMTDKEIQYRLYLNTLKPSKNIIYSNLSRIAYIYLTIKNDYSLAEDYFSQAKKFASTDEERKTTEKNIKITIQNNASSLVSDNYMDAIKEYERLVLKSNESNDVELQDAYLATIDTIYYANKQYQSSIDTKLRRQKLTNSKKKKLGFFWACQEIADNDLKDYTQGENFLHSIVNEFPKQKEDITTRFDILMRYEQDGMIVKRMKLEEKYPLNGITANKDKSFKLLNEFYDYLLTLDVTYGFDKYAFARMILDIILEDFKDFNLLEKQVEKIMANHDDSKDKVQDKLFYLKKIQENYANNADIKNAKRIAKKMYAIDPKNPIIKDTYLTILNAEFTPLAKQAEEIVNNMLSDFKEENLDFYKNELDEVKISYEKLIQKYKKEGVDVSNFEQFFDWLPQQYAYFDLFQELNKIFKYYDKNYFNISKRRYNNFFEVNHKTTWDSHLIDGQERVQKFDRKIESEVENILEHYRRFSSSMIEINGYQIYNMIPKDRQFRILMLIPKLYDLETNVLTVQLNKTINNREFLGMFDKNDPEGIEFYKDIRMKPWIELARTKAIDNYLGFYTLFKDIGLEADVVDELEKVIAERDLMAPETIIPYDINTFIPNNSLEALSNSYSTEFDSIKIVSSDALIAMNKTNWNIMLETNPKRIEFISANNPIKKLEFNNTDFTDNVSKIDVNQDSLKTKYIVKINASAFSEGNYSFNIEFDKKSEKIAFYAKVVYDQEKLEFARTTKWFDIGTDINWLTTLTPDIDSTWVNATQADTRLSLNAKDTFISGALSKNGKFIWGNNSTNTTKETRFFKYEFNIPGNIFEGSLNIAGQQVSTLWINDKFIGKDDFFFDSDEIEIIPMQYINEDLNLKVGKNTIIVEVKSENPNESGVYPKLFIMNLKYLAKIKQEENENE